MKKGVGSNVFLTGVRDGIPLALCYYTVAFSLGIVARNAGLTPFSGFVSSLLTRASAGEFGAYSMFADKASYLAVIIMCFVINLRYILMSASVSQKLAPGTGTFTKILVGCCMTDEVFGISIAYPGYLNPRYTYGAMTIAGVMWAAGTASGIVAGNALPERIVCALGVALFGMFISIVVTAAKRHVNLIYATLTACAVSWLFSVVPYLKEIGSGMRIVILTVLVSSIFAWLKPARGETDDSKVTGDHN